MNKNILFNPFIYFAGVGSFVAGIFVISIFSWLAYISGTHYNGFTQLIFSKNAGIKYFFIENFLHWLILSLLLFVAGLIFSKSKIRLIDVFGTNAISRLPMILIPLIRLLPCFKSFVINSFEMFFLMTLHFLLIAWVLVLMYNAYRISCILKGEKLILSFGFSLIVSEIITKIIVTNLLTY